MRQTTKTTNSRCCSPTIATIIVARQTAIDRQEHMEGRRSIAENSRREWDKITASFYQVLSVSSQVFCLFFIKAFQVSVAIELLLMFAGIICSCYCASHLSGFSNFLIFQPKINGCSLHKELTETLGDFHAVSPFLARQIQSQVVGTDLIPLTPGKLATSAQSDTVSLTRCYPLLVAILMFFSAGLSNREAAHQLWDTIDHRSMDFWWAWSDVTWGKFISREFSGNESRYSSQRHSDTGRRFIRSLSIWLPNKAEQSEWLSVGCR